MKRTIIRIGSILLIASLFFSACKKTDTPTTESAIVENGGLSGKAVTPNGNLSEDPTGILEVTEEQFNSLYKGDFLEAKLAAPHKYIAGRPIPWPPQPPVNPCDQDWIDFANYMNTWHAYMVAWANAHCQPYRGCWCGKCVCIAFQVNPTVWCGDPVKYEKYLKVFE